MGKGFDYGMGQTNIDHENGIRFGVIPQHEVLQAWADSSEPEYGDPHCPKCGNECELTEDIDEDCEDYEVARGSCGDYSCESCRYSFDGDEAFGDEALSYSLDDHEYKATCGEVDIFILRSPYYTRAEYCSPCAPGACYLLNHDEAGDKAYCFGHDWFDEGRAPYPVYSVATNELINP